MALHDELLALEHAGWKSLCDGTGDTFYGGLMTDDAVMVLANGMVMDRDGADEPSEKPFVGAMSSVYHRTAQGWALALYQQSPVASANDG